MNCLQVATDDIVNLLLLHSYALSIVIRPAIVLSTVKIHLNIRSYKVIAFVSIFVKQICNTILCVYFLFTKPKIRQFSIPRILVLLFGTIFQLLDLL